MTDFLWSINVKAVKQSKIREVQSKLAAALSKGQKGEILRVKTVTERRYVMMLAIAHNWDLSTKRDGKEFRVIAA